VNTIVSDCLCMTVCISRNSVMVGRNKRSSSSLLLIVMEAVSFLQLHNSTKNFIFLKKWCSRKLHVYKKNSNVKLLHILRTETETLYEYFHVLRFLGCKNVEGVKFKFFTSNMAYFKNNWEYGCPIY
jgi:hypothetical protein